MNLQYTINKYTHGSMRYKLFDKTQEGLATFGAGCYWGTEKFFVKNFQREFGQCILG